MQWSSFPISDPRRRRDRAVIPSVCGLEGRVLLSATGSHTTAAHLKAAALRQAEADASPGGHRRRRRHRPRGARLRSNQCQSRRSIGKTGKLDQVLTPGATARRSLKRRAHPCRREQRHHRRRRPQRDHPRSPGRERRLAADHPEQDQPGLRHRRCRLATRTQGVGFRQRPAPLTSRTVQQISQTTITQREVDSNPDVPDPNGDSTVYGPGFVAPVGIKGHFPPGIMYTPQVDLFDIEGTNRDVLKLAATGTRVLQRQADAGASRRIVSRGVLSRTSPESGAGNLVAPESYGVATGMLTTAQSRGIATLPGGVPLFKKQPNGSMAEVGGIGVFFPGTTGYATAENSTLNTPQASQQAIKI